LNTSDEHVRRRYAERRAAQHAAIGTLFRELQVDVIEVRSLDDYVPALIGFFKRRERATR
jgi:hypothetical protein